jgi:hypothetical protein
MMRVYCSPARMVQSYIDLYRSYALADIAERTEAQRTNILDIARQRVAAGLDTRVELREAEGALPQARLALTQARNRRRRWPCISSPHWAVGARMNTRRSRGRS